MVNGGCAANAAVAIARLGGRAALAGPLGGPAGEDSNGDRVLAALAREGVDCAGCQRIAGLATALSAIFIDARGDRMIVTYRDDRIATAVPADPKPIVAGANAVLADNRFPDFVRPICAAARERGITVVLDADRPTEMSEDLFRIATHVVFSGECLRATTGVDDLGAALQRVAGTTQAFLAVTNGPGDVLWLMGKPAQEPGLPDQGGRHACRRRRVPRRLHAGARRGPRRGRRHALCRRRGRAQMHAARRQRRGAAARRGGGAAGDGPDHGGPDLTNPQARRP